VLISEEFMGVTLTALSRAGHQLVPDDEI